MSRINFLPPWVETTLQPAFYDKESGSVLQQTARMYAKVNQLIRSVNDQNETIADYIQQFIDLKDYCEDYFENLDVQEEINNKLDQMALDGGLDECIKRYVDPIYQAYTQEIDETVANYNNTFTNRINSLQNEVEAIGNGTPIPASSTAEMTDTTKVYVNTTDGYWYYYDGDSWEQGGVFQAPVESTALQDLSDKVDEISELGRNLYADGDVNKDNIDKAYKEVTLTSPIPAGTYTISAVVHYTGERVNVTKCSLRFRDSGGDVASPNEPQLNTDYPARSYATFTLTAECTKIRFYGSTGSSSQYYTDTATYTDIQIEAGDIMHQYMPYGYTAVDKIAREQINTLQDTIKYVSTTGSDDNTGGSGDPLATMAKAIELGATTVVLAKGTYTENLANPSVTRLTIIGNGSTITYSDGTNGLMDIRKCEVNISDLIFNCTGRVGNVNGILLRECSGRISNCIAYGGYNGFKLDGSHISVFRCEAYNNEIDGFNAHDTSANISEATIIDCFAHDNGDDGLSYHENGKIHVHGGEYNNNGSTGIAPNGGVNCEIIGSYIHDNDSGIECFNTGGAYTPKPLMIVSGCMIVNNTSETSGRGYGISARYYDAVINSTAISGNSAGTIANDGNSDITVY